MTKIKQIINSLNYLPSFSILLFLNSFCFGLVRDFFGEGDNNVFRTGDFQSFQNFRACDSFIGPATALNSSIGFNDLRLSF